jgi:hypothetical protein
MNAHLKTLLTLGVLTVLVLVSLTWGWSALTRPFPHTAAQKPCYPTTYQAGQRIAPPRVLVNVYNASDRVGLAERTMTEFEDQGFGTGSVGNAPQGSVVPFAQVWTTDPSLPDVKLVMSRLGPGAHVIQRKGGTDGVVVVVGPRYQKLVKGLPSVKVSSTTTICSPPT